MNRHHAHPGPDGPLWRGITVGLLIEAVVVVIVVWLALVYGLTL